MKLTIGFSPCPNDTFIFDALVNGHIKCDGFEFEPILADVEELNEMALRGELDITKLSYNAYSHAAEHYQILHSGSALGRGNGPLLVSNKSLSEIDLANMTVLIPGSYTTANFLFKLAYPKVKKVIPALFSDIPDLLLAGKADAGVIIHETRFTYKDIGLELVKDLGSFWEDLSGLPIPLGGIAIKRKFDYKTKQAINNLVKSSLEFAIANPNISQGFISDNAQEISSEVTKKHIDMFVNDFSLDLGIEGRSAISYMYKKGYELGVLKNLPKEIFI